MVILLVEDEKKLADFVKTALEHEHYSVELAFDGDEALKKLAIYDYDLVILDVMLPKKDGFQVCKEIRDMGLKVPVLMLTARDQPADKVAGLNVGADDYVVKPFELNELFARIRALTRRGNDLKPNRLAVGDLVLDTASHEVTRGGKPIDLTSKEYRILEYLMRNEGTVCSRTMINEHIWGFNYVKSNIIDVYMSRLRSKVDQGQTSAADSHSPRGRLQD
ncbi:MAG: response regulator transcription factor [Candidatus Doudnabacteria bacterium]|nr:response regulator transcription factor [Candidatus Doudnabacteria bacterium]